MNYKDYYLNLLITQYYNKPKAKGVITAVLNQCEEIFNCINSFNTEFDLQNAVGRQLDIIGELVGLERGTYKGNIIDDDFYRHSLRLKIAENTVKTTMKNVNGVSLQSAIIQAFQGQAYVIDNLDMSLTLILSPDFDKELFSYIVDNNLLPHPQGVRYKDIIAGNGYFGFKGDNEALGFSSLSDRDSGGIFARVFHKGGY